MEVSKKVINLGFAFFIFLIAPATALTSNSGDHQSNKDPFSRKLNEIISLHAENKEKLEKATAQVASLEKKVGELSRNVETLRFAEERDRSALEKIEAENIKAAYKNKISAVLVVLGMLIEIIGGTLLAGAHLSAKQERITTLRATRPLHDLSLTNTQYEPILNFLGLIGCILIVIGFSLQLGGTLLTSSLPLMLRIMIGALAVALTIFLFTFFLGENPSQTRKEKLSIISHNINRHILIPILEFFSRKHVRCEICLEHVSPNSLQVWWLSERNTSTYPYNNQPNDFSYGHAECLPQCQDFYRFLKHPDSYTSTTLNKENAYKFCGEIAPAIKAWYAEYHDYWTKRRGVPSRKTAHEERFERVCRDLKRLPKRQA